MTDFEYAAWHAFLALLMGCSLALFGDDRTGWIFAAFSMAMAAMHVRLGFRAERDLAAFASRGAA